MGAPIRTYPSSSMSHRSPDPRGPEPPMRFLATMGVRPALHESRRPLPPYLGRPGTQGPLRPRNEVVPTTDLSGTGVIATL